MKLIGLSTSLEHEATNGMRPSNILHGHSHHVLIFKYSGNPFDDVAPQIEVDWDIGILVGFVDSGSYREPHNVAIKQHSSETHRGIRLQFLRCKALFENSQHLAKRQDSFSDKIEPLHPGQWRNAQITRLTQVDIDCAVELPGDDICGGTTAYDFSPGCPFGHCREVLVVDTIKRCACHDEKLSRAPHVHNRAGDVVFRGEAIYFFCTGNKSARQIARRDVRVPVDLLANIGFDPRQPPTKWSAKLTHACLRDAIGEEDDAIFAFYIEAGVADDAVAPAFRP